MAYSYKGAISFGLIYIPITLNVVIKNNDISFNMLDKKTKSRVKYKKTCVDCGNREVKQIDIVKGFEYEDGKYVLFEDDDFEKIKTKRDKNITIETFVDIAEIDPILYDKAYYVVPQGGEQAYNLLLHAMEEEGKVAIAKTVMGTKECLIAIRVKDGQMLLNTLFFNEEVQINPAKEIKSEIKESELKMAKLLIENMSGTFDVTKFKDEYRVKVKKAIETKIAGKKIISKKESDINPVSNLMDALVSSIKELDTKPKKIVKKPSKALQAKAKTTRKKA